MRFLSAFWILAAALAAPFAQAQEWPTDLPPPIIRSGAPTILEGAEGPIFVAEGRAKPGDVIAAFPVRYARVGRLKNDLYTTQLWSNELRLVLPKGTAVFRTQLTRDALDIRMRASGPAYWCGIGLDGKTKRPICWRERDKKPASKYNTALGPYTTLVGPVHTNFSMYFPLGDANIHGGGVSTTVPQFELDESARSELAPMEFVYILTNNGNCNRFVEGGMRVAGKVQSLYDLDYSCSQGSKDGDRFRSMRFSAGDGVICVYGVSGKGADVVVLKPPTIYLHPWDRDILEEDRVERTAAGTWLTGPRCPPQLQ